MNKAEQNKSSEAVRLQETPEQELLPCPFCGHEADGRGRFEDHTIVWHTLTCCTAHKCKIAGIAFTVDEWNTRSHAAQQETIKELVGSLNQCRTLLSALKHRDECDRASLDMAIEVTAAGVDAVIKKAQP